MTSVQNKPKTKPAPLQTRKPQRVTIPVRSRNYNRVKYQTHSLERVLRLEGYILSEENIGKVRTLAVALDNRLIPLSVIDLYPRKQELPAPIPVAEQQA